MKILISLSTILLIGSSVFALNLYQNNLTQQAHLDDYENHVQQLLSQVEEISRRRIDYEKEIAQLQSDLIQSNSQLASLSNQLQSAQDQADPDYVRLENEIRSRVAAEYARQNNSQVRSHTALIRQLSEMDQSEFSNLISMQGRFGEFLNSLNVSDQRMDVIIGALSNMVVQQNQAQQQLMEQQMQLRTDQISEIRASGGGRSEIRARMNNIDFQGMQQQMADIYNPEAQREALAYDLTDDELTAFVRFQENQQNAQPFDGGAFSTTTGVTADGASFIFSNGQIGQGTSGAVRILQAEPQ